MFERAQQILSQAKQIKQNIVALAHEVMSTRPARLMGPVGLVCRYKVVPPKMHVGDLSQTFYHGDILECIGHDTLMVNGQPRKLPNLKAAFASGWLVPQTAPMPNWKAMQHTRWTVQEMEMDEVIKVFQRHCERPTPVTYSPDIMGTVKKGEACPSDLTIDEISSIWGCAPDVSEVFGIDSTAVYKAPEGLCDEMGDERFFDYRDKGIPAEVVATVSVEAPVMDEPPAVVEAPSESVTVTTDPEVEPNQES